MNDIDREEHRLAALAAGYWPRHNHYHVDEEDDFIGIEVKKEEGKRWEKWIPKTNKADSFDLMVDCNIIGGFSKIEQKAMAVHPYSWVECEAGGHDAAADDLMQAIFNCAAAVGRSMEEINEQAAD